MEFRTEKDILEEMIKDAQETNLVTFNDDLLTQINAGNYSENQYIVDLSVHAKTLSYIENKIKEVYNNINVLTATGNGLDTLGNLVSVNRFLAQPSIVDLTVSVQSNNDNIINIPAGTEVLLEGVYSGQNIEYVTSEPASLPAGVTSTTVRAESLDYGVQQSLPIGAVVGLKNFPTLTVTNENESTTGKNIEEDDDYRLRIMSWYIINTKGTKDYIEEYLENYKGLNSFKLIPRYDGIGSLKIVCDCNPSLLNTIAEDVYSRLDPLDNVPVCVLYNNTTLGNLTVTTSVTTDNMSEEEIKQLISNTVKVFVSGGECRDGHTYQGMSIGEDFQPSQLIAFLVKEMPEIVNISLSEHSTITVPNTNKFLINTVNVVVV